MTPQERQLINELFQCLVSLENNPRDPDAEAMIREGLRRAPNAVYSLVQSVLVQDEALKAANARIQQYEGGGDQPQQDRGFLDSMRDSIFGRDRSRGSVPRVPQGGASDTGRSDPWSRDRDGHPVQLPPGYAPQQAYSQPQGYQAGAPMQPQSGGGSFLGTAAAAAAGVIGGSLLMNGIRSAMAGHQGGPASKAFEDFGNRGEGGSPSSGNAANSDLSREAGLNDIAGGRGGGGSGGAQRAGLFDGNQDEGDDSDYDDSGDDGDYDDGGSDGGDNE